MSTFDTAFFERMRDWLDNEAEWFGMHEDNTVEQLSQAFEAAMNPPKPDEPQGLGAVVEDDHGHRWVRAGLTHRKADDWRCIEGEHVGYWGQWSNFTAVRVLSPGVEVDQ